MDTSTTRRDAPVLMLRISAGVARKVTGWCKVYAEGVALTSPGSPSAPWVGGPSLTSTLNALHNAASICGTLSALMFGHHREPRVRFATLGFDVEPRCGSNEYETRNIKTGASRLVLRGGINLWIPRQLARCMWRLPALRAKGPAAYLAQPTGLGWKTTAISRANGPAICRLGVQIL